MGIAKMHEGSGLSFSFAVAGWLMMYYFGVAKAIQEFGLDRGSKFAGSSAGALASVALVLGFDMDELRLLSLDMCQKARSKFVNRFKLRDYLISVMSELFPRERFEDFKSKLNSQLGISVTYVLGLQNKRYTHFESYDHFIDVLCASCCCVPIGGFPFTLDDRIVFDGGFSDLQPLVDEYSITVSPIIFSKADIHPSGYIPLLWMPYPPPPQEFSLQFDLGYYDAKRYFIDRYFKRKSLLTMPLNPLVIDCFEPVHLRKGVRRAGVLPVFNKGEEQLTNLKKNEPSANEESGVGECIKKPPSLRLTLEDMSHVLSSRQVPPPRFHLPDAPGIQIVDAFCAFVAPLVLRPVLLFLIFMEINFRIAWIMAIKYFTKRATKKSDSESSKKTVNGSKSDRISQSTTHLSERLPLSAHDGAFDHTLHSSDISPDANFRQVHSDHVSMCTSAVCLNTHGSGDAGDETPRARHRVSLEYVLLIAESETVRSVYSELMLGLKHLWERCCLMKGAKGCLILNADGGDENILIVRAGLLRASRLYRAVTFFF
eukprot:GDKJ01058493.1.p1 GENE.GDKJ01058493.1~~GDKJ01058493.1.p1  ORF type:complete len:542 (-),score=80.81 GDKJ01058493.1:441-2066(-)